MYSNGLIKTRQLLASRFRVGSLQDVRRNKFVLSQRLARARSSQTIDRSNKNLHRLNEKLDATTKNDIERLGSRVGETVIHWL